MENHTFDNVFGMYPTMNRSVRSGLAAVLQRPDDALHVPRGVGLTQVPDGASWTASPGESSYVADWDNGRMDGFAANSGIQALTYFSSSQLAIEWDWAEEYSIADRYFSSCLCMTSPNRLYSLAGDAAGLTDNSGPPPFIPMNRSIFGQLNDNRVSWGYFVRDPSQHNFVLDYFKGIGNDSSRIQSWAAFDAALRHGSLPSVSWISSVGSGASGISQHPESNVTVGEEWLLGLVNRVMQSGYWNSTAIFVNYDEGGGYYDHVPPPQVDGVQLGFRVPFLVISPYAKENYVSRTVMNHASILAFVDYNWQIPPLNSFVAASGLPIDMFDFNQRYADGTLVRQPILLSNGSRYPIGLQIPLEALPYKRTGDSGVTLKLLEQMSLNASFLGELQLLALAGTTLIVLILYLMAYLDENQQRVNHA